MKNGKRFAFAVAAGAAALSGLVLAQAPPGGQQNQEPSRPQIVMPQQPVYKTSVDLVTTDVIPRDSRGMFVSDLKPGEFELFEDGVKRESCSC